MPDFKPAEVKNFAPWDYVVFAALFIISSGIGVFFAIKERKKATSREFLVGGKQMTSGPVALSLTASFMSAVTVLGAPSEVYRFGSSFLLFFIAYAFVIIFTSELFLPVFYQSGITSTYEYLQLRFNKLVRFAATFIYIVQTVLYTGVVVYAPALALNQVTGFDLWGSVFATGIVCTFYCTLGGLKAVVWTDAFQMIVMIVGFLTVLIQGTAYNGGLENVLDRSRNGSRLEILDALYLNLVGLWIILICAVFSGLIMYSQFKDCDPWTSGTISAPDQLMPYFVMEIFASMPGLPGLFVACAFSGTLSTVAASINALATVTFEDFVRTCFPNLSDKLSTWISKGLCVIFGVICTSMAVAASLMGGVVQAALSIHGMCGGPMLGLFTLGIVFPFASWKGALGGLLIGISLSFWVAIGGFVYPAPASKTHPLVLSTDQCIQANGTGIFLPLAPSISSNRPSLADTWYSLSYLYYSAVGCLGCIVSGLIISLITGPSKGRDIEPRLIRPVANLFCFWSERYKTLCWCGVQHNNKTIHEDLEDDPSWKTGAESALQNGLHSGDQGHVPGYNPSDKSYTNMESDKETHF
ncbi:sodium-coupled monocarboxylate transporter 2 isoform X3 [Ornithorhynchus anatinus]|uniref:Solute carrier family 5 member 12 n=1 Tax=Ornithorhynchus anatinus TaxID=9258 RepID=A0A6I8MYF8_ORNAN|nr:sodium-coupled monocarboxylate transporter 2 isoform X3 [Ornithorhynchus anatinus]